MKAVVMAGGFGTRLRPLTEKLPKPMAHVANRPMMEHVVRLLAAEGIDDLEVLLHFYPGEDQLLLRGRDSLGGPDELRERRGGLRHRGGGEERGGAALRDLHGDQRGHHHRLRPVEGDRLPQGTRGGGHHRPDARPQPPAVRHRDHRGGRPDRPLPREADVGGGLLRHDQHGDLHRRARSARPHPAEEELGLQQEPLSRHAGPGRSPARLRRGGVLEGRRESRRVPERPPRPPGGEGEDRLRRGEGGGAERLDRRGVEGRLHGGAVQRAPREEVRRRVRGDDEQRRGRRRMRRRGRGGHSSPPCCGSACRWGRGPGSSRTSSDPTSGWGAAPSSRSGR